MKLAHVVGARPNFMKVAPVFTALAHYNTVTQKLIHTGQHYDQEMSAIFFQQLQLPQPDFNLEIGSASHAVQTAQIMMRLEELLLVERPDLVLVYGDVNSTVAAALVSAKLQIPIAHVEAGLRSFDRSMPEEINRLVTDQIADLLFTPSVDGNENLRREGVPAERIHFVGNVMIDTLLKLLPLAEQSWSVLKTTMHLKHFALVTLHRPATVDQPAVLQRILATLDEIRQDLQIVFPVHPRTKKQIEMHGLTALTQQFQLIKPLGYLDFLALQAHARLVITDSGGVQEETTYLGVPCLTLRENTERPITVTCGTNILIGHDMARLTAEIAAILQGNAKRGSIPEQWDGQAGERVAHHVVKN
jgi:UDP-N-acetylglucosamine 2-epimerase (non-hydrolysing)